MPQQPFSLKDDYKKSFWMNIHFGRVVVWCGRNWKIIHFFKASILPCVHFSIIPFFQIILALNLYTQCGMELNEFCPPNRSDDLCLFFCTNPYLCLRGNDVKVRHCDKTGYFFPFTVKIVFVFIFLISVLLFFHSKNMFVNNKQLTKNCPNSYEYKCSSKIYDRGCFAII